MTILRELGRGARHPAVHHQGAKAEDSLLSFDRLVWLTGKIPFEDSHLQVEGSAS